MTEAVRLAKRLAASVPCSRGEAERYIAGGWVLVDGQVVEEPGLRVLPQQRVELLPQANSQAPEPVTLLLHKPAGTAADSAALLPFFSAVARAAEDHTRIRFLKRHLDSLTLLAPLETRASGLQVLSQDWRVVRKLMDDLAGIEQEYIVEVTGAAGPDVLARLNQGWRWNGTLLAPAKVSWQNETRLRVALKAPQAGQIAAMCGQAGLTVAGLKRIRIGRVPMAGLALGEWRYLAGYQRF